jgi:hypothetical protein
MNMKTLVIILVLLLAAFTFAAGADLSGTWKGGTEVDGAAVDLTLVLKKAGASYSGTITDSAGYSDNSEIENVKLEASQLSFSFMINNGVENLSVQVALEVDGITMKGNWESEDGNSGSIKMEKT